MTESIRPHIRVSAENCTGQRIQFEFQERTVQLFIPENYSQKSGTNLIIHFHGMPEVTEYGICDDTTTVMATINAGSGSASYEKLFTESENFTGLLDRIADELESNSFMSISLSGWSAGYGAIRTLIPEHEKLINNIILLDGLHTSYIPDNLVLYRGGKLDTTNLFSFYQFAEKAVRSEKKMVITHSSVFPGTYASTTECTDYLIRTLGLTRKTVLRPGPVGMQQVGEVRSGNFSILSYAGNSAPDHVDHLHGLKYFLNQLN